MAAHLQAGIEVRVVMHHIGDDGLGSDCGGHRIEDQAGIVAAPLYRRAHAAGQGSGFPHPSILHRAGLVVHAV